MAKKEKIKENVNTRQFITFRIDTEIYGIDVMNIESIERLAKITRVPHSKEYVLGVINLRGNIVPIINLRRILGFKDNKYDDSVRIIIIRLNEYTAGFIVDSVVEVLTVPETHIQESAEILEQKRSELVEGVIQHQANIVMLLDIKKTLDSDSKQE